MTPTALRDTQTTEAELARGAYPGLPVGLQGAEEASPTPAEQLASGKGRWER